MNIRGEGKKSPLHIAIQVDSLYAFDKLIEAGSDVHSINRIGNTPLHIAALKGNSRMILKLLEMGVNSKVLNRYKKLQETLPSSVGKMNTYCHCYLKYLRYREQILFFRLV